MATRLSRPFMKRIVLTLGAGLLVAGCAHSRNPGDSPALPASAARHVVLVHGLFETGSSFKLLKQRLERHGIQCLVPKLQPCDGRGGLERLATQLKNDIDTACGPTQPIAIVGFSMGGLVSRYYLQNLGGATRCQQLITIATPHHGTDSAWYYPTLGAEQMRPDSRFLTDLARTQDKLGTMRLVSYRTPMDQVIYPPESSVWDRAENIEYKILLHSMMLTSNTVMTDIERRILAADRRVPGQVSHP
jgi:triacylglycerol lipase